MVFFHSLPVPELREWVFSIPFPFPNFGNGIIHSCSCSRTPKCHSRSPLQEADKHTTDLKWSSSLGDITPSRHLIEFSGSCCALKYVVFEFEYLRTLSFEYKLCLLLQPQISCAWVWIFENSAIWIYTLCAAAASMVLLVSESEKGLQAINQIATIHHFRTMLP